MKRKKVSLRSLCGLKAALTSPKERKKIETTTVSDDTFTRNKGHSLRLKETSFQKKKAKMTGNKFEN